VTLETTTLHANRRERDNTNITNDDVLLTSAVSFSISSNWESAAANSNQAIIWHFFSVYLFYTWCVYGQSCTIRVTPQFDKVQTRQTKRTHHVHKNPHSQTEFRIFDFIKRITFRVTTTTNGERMWTIPRFPHKATSESHESRFPNKSRPFPPPGDPSCGVKYVVKF
jgi:hypothetical protein